MAYCRWSDCDVYVYEGQDGWVTHVASRRNKAGYPPDFDWENVEASFKARNAWSEANQEYVEIGLPDAGESYLHNTPGECAENLIRLKREGFNVPQYAIDELIDEEMDRGE